MMADIIDLIRVQFRVHGYGEYGTRHGFGNREIPAYITKILIGILQMQKLGY